jgi:hypothetical protein
MPKIDISKPVKFSKPKTGEEELIFFITNYNDVTKRCCIKPINLEGCTEGQEPELLVSINDVVNV